MPQGSLDSLCGGGDLSAGGGKSLGPGLGLSLERSGLGLSFVLWARGFGRDCHFAGLCRGDGLCRSFFALASALGRRGLGFRRRERLFVHFTVECE